MLLTVGAACINTTPLDWEGNINKILAVLKEADLEGVGLLCLPELCITGYGVEDFFHSPDVCNQAMAALEEIIQKAPIKVAFCVGLPLIYKSCLYNVVAVVQERNLLGFVAKQNLAGNGIHYEPRWFKPWPKGKSCNVTNGSFRSVPFGDLHFDFGGVRVGFEICEDAWVSNRPGAELSRKNVNIILNPSASHFAFGKTKTRRRFVEEGARAFNVTYVYANLVGNEAGRVIYDGDCLIAGQDGKLLAEGPRFTFQNHVLTKATVDTDNALVSRLGLGSYTPDLEALPTRGKLLYSFQCLPQEVESVDWTKGKEFEAAVTLGLWDYMRKSKSNGFVISLSGGADSAACAYLVHKTFLRAKNEAGYTGDFKNFLACIYQSTENSSQTTRNAAKELASEIGCAFHQISVDSIVKSYTRLIEASLNKVLSWEKDDIALQNIQARVRAPSAWMIANLENKLLITTSNRSEAAVGYCTMDGDTAGSLAPIAGVSKAFILEWLRSPAIQGVYTSAAGITVQKPTAELRPGESQTDEEDLMPYDVLDAMETAAIEYKKGPVGVTNHIHRAYPSIPLKRVVTWVEKFFTLWSRNQWKRDRYAPSFQIDSRNLDPRTWCRYPILSAGYVKELADLRAKYS